MGDKDIHEIKVALSKIGEAVNDLRVLIAGSYVTKEDLLKHKEDNDKSIDELRAATQGQVPGWLLIILPILSGLVVGLAEAILK